MLQEDQAQSEDMIPHGEILTVAILFAGLAGIKSKMLQIREFASHKVFA